MCVTKIIYYIFMQKCSEICKNLFHYVKRTEVCTCHDLNSGIPLSHKIKQYPKEIHSQADTCTQHWENVYLLCGYVDEHQLSVQNVYLFFYSLDFDMEWQQWKPAAETTQPRKRDLRCSSLCCQWKWLSGYNWWAEIKCLQMDECIKIYWWILNHSKYPFFFLSTNVL